MKILIITGGSKGIGKAIAQKYITENYAVYSLSRSKSESKYINDVVIDLSNVVALEKLFTSLFNTLPDNISEITLINNAGRLGEVANLEHLNPIDISKTIQLNTTTPLILSSLFIKLTESWSCKKQIINISSGAAVSPYQGWSVYCTSKAAIDMMTKTIAEEQHEKENGVHCLSIYPGVVDTNMQVQIRQTTKENFKKVDRFKNLKANNELYTPQYVAEQIFKLQHQLPLYNGSIIDVRDI